MLWWFAQTTLIAGALVVVATLASRCKWLGSEARHALWLVVLIKLAIPPVVAWPWRVPNSWPSRVESSPAVSNSPSLPPVAVAVAPPPSPIVDLTRLPIEPPSSEPPPVPRVEVEVVEPPLTPVGSPSPEELLAAVPPVAEAPVPEIPAQKPIQPQAEVPASRPITSHQPEVPPQESEIWNQQSPVWNPQSLIIGLWLLGSLIVLIRRSIKVVRFQRSVSNALAAPGWLVEETRAIGERVGVRPPPVVMTLKVLTPLLWCLGRPRLILPEALVNRLDADRWPGILAHELAHLARRDHWVVRLELLVEAFWWWNPLFWHVRRKLHEEAELACDARVVRSLPERRFAYAEALVDVCEHLARSAIPSPALGVGGAGASRSLEGRLLMILRDPIPRRPSRAAALVALLLVALALPAWTLGQQEPKVEPVKPAAVPAPGDAKPEAPPRSADPQPLPPGVKPSSEASEATIETIRKAQDDRMKGLKSLSFRYVVTARERSMPRDQWSGRGMGGGMGGMGSQGGMMSMPPQGPPVGMSNPQVNETNIRVRVADVTLAIGKGSKVDVLEALGEEEPEPGTPAAAAPQVFTWDRQFVAKDGSGIMALETAWDTPGPAPFRWLWGGNTNQTPVGDTLASWMIAMQVGSTMQDTALDPLDPRPENLLDLTGSTTLILKPTFARAEVVGIDLIDGQEAVRVAWISNQWGIRGLCWFVPKLGFALARFEATRDPFLNQMPAYGRMTWRKQASEFARVGNHWLPGKIAYDETQANPVEGGEPVYRMEQRVAFEDIKIDPANPPASAFHPKLAIQGLDDKTGQFTALPPELPAGLLDRLKKAAQESPFGPAGEGAAPELKPLAPQPLLPLTIPAPAPPQQPRLPLVLPAPGQPQQVQKDAAKADPGIIAQPRPGFEDPIPVSKPRTNDPIPVKDPGDRAAIAPVPKALPADRKLDEFLQSHRDGKAFALERAQAHKKSAVDVLHRNQELLRKDSASVTRADLIKSELALVDTDRDVINKMNELAEFDQLLKQARSRWDAVKAPIPGPADGPIGTVTGPKAVALDNAEAVANPPQKSVESRPEPAPKSTSIDRSLIARLQTRRDGKAADVQKAEAQKTLAQAVVTRNEKLLKKSPNYVSAEDETRAHGELAIADAEVASRKADLAEAEILLANARQPGLPSLPLPTGNEPPSNLPSSSLAELRDAVELLEIQLLGKQAELRGAEMKVQYASTKVEDRGAARGLAKSEVEQKKVEVQEYEIRLKQAKRRVEVQEARIKREVERAKDQLSRSEELQKKGIIGAHEVNINRAAYDDLMLQLDPKSIIAPVPVVASPPIAPVKGTPALDVKITGEKTRFSGQNSEYKIRVSNPGTIAAKRAKVAVSLPKQGGKLVNLPVGARFDLTTRKLIWSFPQVEPGQVINLSFVYATSSPGLYLASVEVGYDDDYVATDTFETEVKGYTAVDLQISQTQRVIDVGKTMHYDITIKNVGTKDATRLELRGNLTKNLKLLKPFNIDKGEFKFHPERGEFIFPQIERLGVGQSKTLSLEVQATETGPAGCHVFLGHAEMADDQAPYEDVISTTITKTEPAKDEPRK